MSVRRTTAAVVTLVPLVSVLAGCGGGSGGGGGSSPAAAAPPNATTVTATETDYKIALSSASVAAGTYTIKAVNSGQVTHALEINGPGVSDKTTAGISPSSSASLTVTLSKGSYEIWCPVANHKAMGMDTHLTVS
jgi:uncharacterized cupredoxin-like copper-binding protein